jgi:hypothetical protein
MLNPLQRINDTPIVTQGEIKHYVYLYIETNRCLVHALSEGQHEAFSDALMSVVRDDRPCHYKSMSSNKVTADAWAADYNAAMERIDSLK